MKHIGLSSFSSPGRDVLTARAFAQAKRQKCRDDLSLACHAKQHETRRYKMIDLSLYRPLKAVLTVILDIPCNHC